MDCKTKTIFIERTNEDNWSFVSQNYTEEDISECQMMSLLGAMLGVTITHPNNDKCSWCINVIKISPD